MIITGDSTTEITVIHLETTNITKLPITAVIITKNEADRIKPALLSVQFCKEILVIDSGSDDGTQDLSQKIGAQVVQQEFLGFGAQKNYGFSLATQPWILSIDADERVNAALANAISQAMADPKADGYYVKRKNYFLGKALKYGREGNDWLLRLFRKGQAQYGEELVHEQMIAPANTMRLKGELIHHTYRSWRHAREKMTRYALLGAEELKRKGKSRPRWLIQLLKPVYFFKHYIIYGNILNGLVGMRWSLLMTHYHTKKYRMLHD